MSVSSLKTDQKIIYVTKEILNTFSQLLGLHTTILYIFYNVLGQITIVERIRVIPYGLQGLRHF